MNEAGEMDIGRLKKIVLGALERSGQRAVLLTGGALSLRRSYPITSLRWKRSLTTGYFPE